jgi:hypothetical protein
MPTEPQEVEDRNSCFEDDILLFTVSRRAIRRDLYTTTAKINTTSLEALFHVVTFAWASHNIHCLLALRRQEESEIENSMPSHPSRLD